MLYYRVVSVIIIVSTINRSLIYVVFVDIILLVLTSASFSLSHASVAYPRILFGGGGFNKFRLGPGAEEGGVGGGPQEFVGGGGVQQIQLRTEDRDSRDLGGGSPLVRGSGGSCNLVQEISFHIVKFFLIFGTLRLFMTTNLFVIANVRQLRT